MIWHDGCSKHLTERVENMVKTLFIDEDESHATCTFDSSPVSQNVTKVRAVPGGWPLIGDAVPQAWESVHQPRRKLAYRLWMHPSLTGLLTAKLHEVE
jgi:hypothetical protein